jgi:hypothetical protein
MISRRSFVLGIAVLAVIPSFSQIAQATQSFDNGPGSATDAFARRVLNSISRHNYDLFAVLCERKHEQERPMPRHHGDIAHAARILTYHLARSAADIAESDMDPMEKMEAFDWAAGVAWYRTKWLEFVTPYAELHAHLADNVAPYANPASTAQILSTLLDDEDSQFAVLCHVMAFEQGVTEDKKQAMLAAIAARKAGHPNEPAFRPYRFDRKLRGGLS